MRYDLNPIFTPYLSLPHPTKEIQIELQTKYKEGDLDAANMLLKYFLRFIFSMAQMWAGRWVYNQQLWDEVVAVSLVGFWMAVQDWKPETGALTTIAMWKIRSRISFWKRGQRYNAKRYVYEDEDEIEIMDDSLVAYDQLDFIEQNQLHDMRVTLLLERLPRHAAEVFQLHYLRNPPLTFEEIAAQKKCTKQNIHSIERNAIRLVKAFMVQLEDEKILWRLWKEREYKINSNSIKDKRHRSV